jgi:DNA-binding CsgD family transcriptional regulator
MAHNESQEPPDVLGSRRRTTAVVLFVAIALLIGLDLAGDASTGADRDHLAVEGLVMAFAVAGAASLWQGRRRAEVRAARLDVDLAEAREEARRYRAEARDALRGLGEAIDRQFARWALTPAEREVGLLLLKGLSHREVAEIRATGEPTVRQQALAIYRKSGLRNRADLSAYFLEDLLLPHDQATDA